MSAGFRGASASQDSRFSNKEQKLLKTLKFSEELSFPVDFKKVNMDSIREWVTKRVTELLNFEDEVVVGLAMNLMEEEKVNAKLMQIQLTPFLEANTGQFMTELWKLLVSAQKTPSGVPQEFLDAKAEEARKKRELERQFDERFRESSRNTGRYSQHSYQSRGSRWEGGKERRSRDSRWDRGNRVRGNYRDRDRDRHRDRERSASPRRYSGHARGETRRYRRRSPSYDRYRGREEEDDRRSHSRNHQPRQLLPRSVAPKKMEDKTKREGL